MPRRPITPSAASKAACRIRSAAASPAVSANRGRTAAFGAACFSPRPRPPVRSVADGTVAYAGALNGYGNTVVIDYGDGYTGVYTGLSSIAVGSGGSVKTGGTIGTSGSLPSGEQGLYFEIRYRLAAMNPAAWLR